MVKVLDYTEMLMRLQANMPTRERMPLLVLFRMLEVRGLRFYQDAKFLELPGNYLSSNYYEAIPGEHWVRPLFTLPLTNRHQAYLPDLIQDIPTLADYVAEHMPEFDGVEVPAVSGPYDPTTIGDYAYQHDSIIANVMTGYDNWWKSLTAKRRYKIREAFAMATSNNVVIKGMTKLPPELTQKCLDALLAKWGPDDFALNATNFLWPHAADQSYFSVGYRDGELAYVAAGYVLNCSLVFNSFVAFSDLNGLGTLALHDFVKHACDQHLEYMNSTASTFPDYDRDEPSYVYKHVVCNAVHAPKFVTIYGGLPGCDKRIPCYDPAKRAWVK